MDDTYLLKICHFQIKDHFEDFIQYMSHRCSNGQHLPLVALSKIQRQIRYYLQADVQRIFVSKVQVWSK